MRRRLTVLSAFLLLLSAAPVSAAPPTKEDQPPFVNEFAPGETCDFAVRMESIEIKAKTITFDRRDGVIRQNTNGQIVERITNLSTGASVERKSSGPGRLTVAADGHLTIRFGGASVLAFFDGDVTGRGLLYVKGGGAEFVTDTDGFFFVAVRLPAHVEDLCATLG